MKNFKLFVPIVFGLLIVLNIRAGSPTDFNSDSVKITEPTTDLVEITPGKDYDFSYLKPGETAELVYNDNDETPFVIELRALQAELISQYIGVPWKRRIRILPLLLKGREA